MLASRIEAVLFVAAKPLEVKTLAHALRAKPEEIEAALERLSVRLNCLESGVHLIRQGTVSQLASNPAWAEDVRLFTKEELGGELTRPALETLSVIAYRGPVTKPEIEQVRGVNCALILRNLLQRGLIEEKEDAARLQAVYSVSAAFLRHMGLHDLSDLPEFETIHTDDRISRLLTDASQGEMDL